MRDLHDVPLDKSFNQSCVRDYMARETFNMLRIVKLTC